MPILPGKPPDDTPRPAYAPDLTNVDPDQAFKATFAQEDLTYFLPDNFDELSPEEQEEAKAKYRFTGVRYRGDRVDQPTTVNRETLDTP